MQILKILNIPGKNLSEVLFDIDCSKGQQPEYKYNKEWDKTTKLLIENVYLKSKANCSKKLVNYNIRACQFGQ